MFNQFLQIRQRPRVGLLDRLRWHARNRLATLACLREIGRFLPIIESNLRVTTGIPATPGAPGKRGQIRLAVLNFFRGTR